MVIGRERCMARDGKGVREGTARRASCRAALRLCPRESATAWAGSFLWSPLGVALRTGSVPAELFILAAGSGGHRACRAHQGRSGPGRGCPRRQACILAEEVPRWTKAVLRGQDISAPPAFADGAGTSPRSRPRPNRPCAFRCRLSNLRHQVNCRRICSNLFSSRGRRRCY